MGVVDKLEQAEKLPDAHEQLMCAFDPHCGVRIQTKGHTQDYVICFTCGQYLKYVDDSAGPHGLINFKDMEALRVPLDKELLWHQFDHAPESQPKPSKASSSLH
ncbi:MAG TPA: hypothetical protein V6C81_06950 [Planktothrix sp.]